MKKLITGEHAWRQNYSKLKYPGKNLF